MCACGERNERASQEESGRGCNNAINVEAATPASANAKRYEIRKVPEPDWLRICKAKVGKGNHRGRRGDTGPSVLTRWCFDWFNAVIFAVLSLLGAMDGARSS